MCACSHFSGYTTNLFTCRLTYLAPFARAQFLVTLPEDRQGLVSYSFLLSSSSSFFFFFFFFFLLLSSGNTSFSHTFLHLILTKLAHSDRYLNHYSHTKDGGVRGHYGVTGVKKVIFTKNASSPSDYVASTRDFCICSQLDPLHKSYGPKKLSGVIWGHWGQKFIFPKKASSPSDYVALTRDLCICSSLTPSTKVMVLKINPGSFGVTGVKRSFSLKML